jgi:hypothetical protein
LDFMGFSFKTSKSKNDINYIKYHFSHTFGKVCRWLSMYYSHVGILIFFKVKTISIWIILKNLVWIHKDCIFYCFWSTVHWIHPWTNHMAFRCKWVDLGVHLLVLGVLSDNITLLWMFYFEQLT